jgi:adenylylsulfate kinase
MAQTSGFTVWLTGMSGTGKTTLANYLAPRLRQVGRNAEVLDERPIAEELWGTVGDSKEERTSAIRRLGLLAQLLSRNNVAVFVAAVSPYKPARDENRRAIGRYVEVYVDCPTDKLIERDSSGRYKKALGGEIPNFIGITEPYEPPGAAEVTIHSDVETIDEGGRKVLQALLDLGYITREEMQTISGDKAKIATKKAAHPKASKRPAARGARKARPTARAARVAKAAKKPKKKKASKRKSR